MSRGMPRQAEALFGLEALARCVCGCGPVEPLRLGGDVNTCPCLAIFRGADCQADQSPAVRGPKRQPFEYYLGGRPNWLSAPELIDQDVPLFVSAPTLYRYKTRGDAFPLRRWGRWALDSGAFMAILANRSAARAHPWHMDADDYGSFAVRLIDDLGMPDFAAPQDIPCEPVIRRRTGLTTRQHCELTVANYLHLAENFPMVPWMPVIQGWEAEDYLYCAELYAEAGVDLTRCTRVGIGSICRRGHVPSIVEVIRLFADRGYLMHAFGVKTTALPIIGGLLASADSYAWSENARKNARTLPGCEHWTRPHPVTGERTRTDCRNCPRYAVAWRGRVLASMARSGLALAA